MRILILDDELKSREVLKALIQLYCENVEAIETCPDIKSAEKLLKSFKPDLLFLDISLREGDSFQLLNSLDEFNFEVIFITAFDENSIRALTYCGITCLMKPIEIDQLEEAVNRVSKQLHTSQSFTQYSFAKHLLAHPIQQLPVFSSTEQQLIPLQHISRLAPHKGQTLITLTNQQQILSTSEITLFQHFLSKSGFQINRNGEMERV